MYVPTDLPSTNRLSQQINDQTKVIQEVVSLEVPKLNHTAMNKKQGKKIPVSSRKKTRKNKVDSCTTHHTSRRIVL